MIEESMFWKYVVRSVVYVDISIYFIEKNILDGIRNTLHAPNFKRSMKKQYVISELRCFGESMKHYVRRYVGINKRILFLLICPIFCRNVSSVNG